MSLKQKSIKGLAWDFIGRIGLQGVGFFVSIILARILSPEDFGLLAIIVVIINLASVFLDFGFSTALIQRSSVEDSHYASVFYLNVAMGFLLAGIVFFLAPYIAAAYENDELKNLVRFMSLSFIINSFGNVTRAYLRREMNFRLISLSSVLAALLSGILAVYMAWAGYGVWSLAVQTIVNQLIANVGLYAFSQFRHSFAFRFRSIKELWPFSSKLFFSGILDTLFFNADTLIIGKLLSPTTLGYYYRARTLENFSTRYTAGTIASVLLPGLSSLQNDTEKLKHSVVKIFHVLSFISFFTCGLLLVTSRETIILLFSEKWEPSVTLFQIMISGAFATQIFSVFYNTLLSTGNTGEYLKINAANKLLLFINLSSLFIWGIYEYLIILIIIRIVIFIAAMAVVTKLLSFGSLFYKSTIKFVLIYVISVGIVFFFKHFFPITGYLYSFAAASILFCFLFTTLSYFLKSEGLSVFTNELIRPLTAKFQRND